MIAWSTPGPETREPERLGVIDLMVAILFPGVAADAPPPSWLVLGPSDRAEPREPEAGQ